MMGENIALGNVCFHVIEIVPLYFSAGRIMHRFSEGMGSEGGTRV